MKIDLFRHNIFSLYRDTYVIIIGFLQTKFLIENLNRHMKEVKKCITKKLYKKTD